MPSVQRADSAQERITAVVAAVSACLEEAVRERGRAGLIVSGGSTPRPVFEVLAQQALPWDRVTITLADERWVAPTENDSNEHLVRGHLLQGRAAAAQFIALKNNAADAAAGVPAAAQALEAFPWPADALMLGMGDDGHTASLFPKAPELTEALRTQARCIAVTPPAAPHRRMSLSAHALLQARRVFIDITGPGKWATYERAAAPGPVEEMPVRLLLQQDHIPVHVHWSP